MYNAEAAVATRKVDEEFVSALEPISKLDTSFSHADMNAVLCNNHGISPTVLGRHQGALSCFQAACRFLMQQRRLANH